MSELFNLSHVFSENSMLGDMIKKYVPKTFLSESVDILRDQDKSNFESLNTLYSALQEAESKAEENSKFADYFREYSKIVERYIFKARELASQFSINIETFADANKDILDVPDNANIMDTATYIGVQYKNLLNQDIPNIEPYKAFKKEFVFIGQLLQDLGPDVKEETKAQVIATVCNNLSKEINDGWVNKVVEKIADCDDCDKDGFARTIYNKFVADPKKEMQVDVALVKEAKLAIMNYTNYISSVEKSVEDFCNGIQKVSDEIGSMFFRNKDHKLPIKTDVDGVEDRTYRLGDYSMNQINIFLSTKISQITEICNLYLIAISIKMDCISKYLHQCKDIIDTASAGIDNTPNNEVDPGDPDDDNDGTPDDGVEFDNQDDDVDGVEPDDKNMSDTDNDNIVQDNSETDIEQECYLFEANIFNKERYVNYCILQDTYLTEADDNNAGGDNNNSGNNNQQQAQKKSLGAVIQNILAQIKRLIQKFINSFTTKHAQEIYYVDKNKDRILKAVIPDNWRINRFTLDPLLQLQIADYSDADIDLLLNRTQYMQSKYKNIVADVQGENPSVKDMIMAKVYNENEEKYTDNDRKTGIDYITKTYKVALNGIRNAEKRINNAANKAKVTITKESSDIMDEAATMLMYFNEDGSDITDEAKEKNRQANPQTAQNSKKQDAIRAYFNINSAVITAVMNILEQAFNRHFVFLSKLATLNGADPIKKDDNANDNNNQNNNQEQQNNA